MIQSCAVVRLRGVRHNWYNNGCANIEPKFGAFLESIRKSDGKQVDTKE
jgi:hypothetical protein